jgi:HTH-type transcriptional regulator / antitoxin HipB
MKPDIARTSTELGAALRRRRRALKLSQAELAERASMRQATVSSAEAGDLGIKLTTIVDLLAALGLELVVRPRDAAASKSIEDIF